MLPAAAVAILTRSLHRGLPVGHIVYTCCATWNTESRDESVGQHRLFKEPVKCTQAKSLLPFLGGSSNLVFSWHLMHCHCVLSQ